MTVGIVDMAFYIPQKTLSLEHVANMTGIDKQLIFDRLGFKQIHVTENNEHCSNIALNAVNTLFENNIIDKNNIDLIIFASNGINDYQFWSPASFIKEKAQIKNAFAVDISNGCNAGSTALIIAKSLLLSNTEYTNALIVASDTLSKVVNYKDSKLFPFFSCSDGAVACLIKKGYAHNSILYHSTITDSELNDICHIKAGGTKTPYDDLQKDDHYINYDHSDEKLRNALYSKFTPNYVNVINQTLHKSNLQVSDIKYFFFTQNSKGVLSNVMQELGIKNHQTHMTALEYGHMGSVDSFFAWDLCNKKNNLNTGDYIMLATAGIGYNFGSCLIKI